jgi:hypothetical protein
MFTHVYEVVLLNDESVHIGTNRPDQTPEEIAAELSARLAGAHRIFWGRNAEKPDEWVLIPVGNVLAIGIATVPQRPDPAGPDEPTGGGTDPVVDEVTDPPDPAAPPAEPAPPMVEPATYANAT